MGVITPLKNQEFLIHQHIQDVFMTAHHSGSSLALCSPSRSRSHHCKLLSSKYQHLSLLTKSQASLTHHSPQSSAQPPLTSDHLLSSTFLFHSLSVPVEVSTVDKYQGRDKECIIMSFVRNNSMENVSCHLKVVVIFRVYQNSKFTSSALSCS